MTIIAEQRSPDDRLMKPAEVAEAFRVDPQTVTRWANAGKITTIRTLGGHRRYLESEIQALLPDDTMTASAAGRPPGVLPAEDRLELLRADYMDLLAAARAAVAAYWAGDEYPLSHLVALLEHKGQLPEAGASPAVVRSSARLPGVAA